MNIWIYFKNVSSFFFVSFVKQYLSCYFFAHVCTSPCFLPSLPAVSEPIRPLREPSIAGGGNHPFRTFGYWIWLKGMEENLGKKMSKINDFCTPDTRVGIKQEGWWGESKAEFVAARKDPLKALCCRNNTSWDSIIKLIGRARSRTRCLTLFAALWVWVNWIKMPIDFIFLTIIKPSNMAWRQSYSRNEWKANKIFFPSPTKHNAFWILMMTAVQEDFLSLSCLLFTSI